MYYHSHSNSKSEVFKSLSDSQQFFHAKHSHKKAKKHCFKPKKSETYDGQADRQAFYKFMRQTTKYLEAFDVNSYMIASHVSNFLKGTAYEF